MEIFDYMNTVEKPEQKKNAAFTVLADRIHLQNQSCMIELLHEN